MLSTALHLLAAAFVCFVLRAPAPILLVGLILGLLPDIDTPRSVIGRLVTPLSQRIEARYGHRTITHSLCALALVGGLAWWLVPTSWPALVGAYASHLLLDLLIGVQGIQLFWPIREELTLTSWRDNGPAPQRLLLFVLPLVIVAALWETLWPILRPPFEAAAAVANPIATPKPSPSMTRTPTIAPSIHLSFALPHNISLSVLQVKQGDAIHEGQVLASWAQPSATPWPTPTNPVGMPTPAAPAVPVAIGAPASGDSSAVISAQAALAALHVAQLAERAALVAEQQRTQVAAERDLHDARQALTLLQPQHERDQQEAQHAVDAANVALTDAQRLALYDDRTDPAATQRFAERVHSVEAALREALDAQDRMRTAQGTARQQAEDAITQAQADLAMLPAQHAAALAKLDADHAAAVARAQGQLDAAQAAASAQAQARSDAHAQQLVAATMQALRVEAGATATAVAWTWAEEVTATAQAHGAAVTATVQAQPTAAPNSVISRAVGRIVAIDAEERDGILLVRQGFRQASFT